MEKWTCKRCGNTTFRKAWQLTKTNHRIIWRFCEGSICQYKEIDHIEPPLTKPEPKKEENSFQAWTNIIQNLEFRDKKHKPKFTSINGHLVKIS